MRDDLAGANWRKARRSGNGNNCVEVVLDRGPVAVRDSKDQSGPVLRYCRTAWATFVDAARNQGFMPKQ